MPFTRAVKGHSATRAGGPDCDLATGRKPVVNERDELSLPYSFGAPEGRMNCRFSRPAGASGVAGAKGAAEHGRQSNPCSGGGDKRAKTSHARRLCQRGRPLGGELVPSNRPGLARSVFRAPRKKHMLAARLAETASGHRRRRRYKEGTQRPFPRGLWCEGALTARTRRSPTPANRNHPTPPFVVQSTGV
jgi:hypothetical protein